MRCNEKFRIINQKYTSVTISHRLASARQTDVIFVIENGRVSGSGSRETLYRETGCTGRCTTVKGAGIRDEETKRMFYQGLRSSSLFLKIAGAMPVVFLLFLVVNVLHGTAWALETLARQVF